ncbi:MAG: DnaJ domain-containing protein [Desulfuromonadaceae bacterium]|nr:DnaJ domain-containing protein [Desulfuromonadaceae bacterium]
MTQQDYYQILGIGRDADAKAVKEAYRKLALQYHPDRNLNDPQAASRMKELNEAYAVLSDPRKREEYDLLRRTHGEEASFRYRQNHTDQDIFRDSDIFQIFEEISKMAGMRGFEEIFREMYGKEFQTFIFRGHGVNGRVSVGRIGGKNNLFNKVLGKVLRKGIQEVFGVDLPQRGADREESLVVADSLARDGGKIRYYCGGQKKHLVVTIPAGVATGSKIRLKGMGNPGKGGGQAGDLYLRVQVSPAWMSKLSRGIRQMADRVLSLVKK